MTFNEKGPKVERASINVNGYSDNQKLHEINNKYVRNIGKENFERECVEERYFDRDWRVPIWYNMYEDMRRRLRRWKNKTM